MCPNRYSLWLRPSSVQETDSRRPPDDTSKNSTRPSDSHHQGWHQTFTPLSPGDPHPPRVPMGPSRPRPTPEVRMLFPRTGVSRVGGDRSKPSLADLVHPLCGKIVRVFLGSPRLGGLLPTPKLLTVSSEWSHHSTRSRHKAGVQRTGDSPPDRVNSRPSVTPTGSSSVDGPKGPEQTPSTPGTGYEDTQIPRLAPRC